MQVDAERLYFRRSTAGEDKDSLLFLVDFVPSRTSDSANISYFVALCICPTMVEGSALLPTLQSLDITKIIRGVSFYNLDLCNQLLMIPEAFISMFMSRIVNIKSSGLDTISVPRQVFNRTFSEVLPGYYTVNNPQRLKVTRNSHEFSLDNTDKHTIRFVHDIQHIPLGYLMSYCYARGIKIEDNWDVNEVKKYSLDVDNAIYLSSNDNYDCYPSMSVREFERLIRDGKLPFPDDEYIDLAATEFTDSGLFGSLGAICAVNNPGMQGKMYAHPNMSLFSSAPPNLANVFLGVDLDPSLLNFTKEVADENIMIPSGITSARLSMTEAGSGKIFVPKTVINLSVTATGTCLVDALARITCAGACDAVDYHSKRSVAKSGDVAIRGSEINRIHIDTFSSWGTVETLRLTSGLSQIKKVSVYSNERIGIDMNDIPTSEFELQFTSNANSLRTYDSLPDLTLSQSLKRVSIDIGVLFSDRNNLWLNRDDTCLFSTFNLPVKNNTRLSFTTTILRRYDCYDLLKLAKTCNMYVDNNSDEEFCYYSRSSDCLSCQYVYDSAEAADSDDDYADLPVDEEHLGGIPALYLIDELNVYNTQSGVSLKKVLFRVLRWYCVGGGKAFENDTSMDTSAPFSNSTNGDIGFYVLLAKQLNFYNNGDLLFSVGMSECNVRGCYLRDAILYNVVCNRIAEQDRRKFERKFKSTLGVTPRDLFSESDDVGELLWKFVNNEL